MGDVGEVECSQTKRERDHCERAPASRETYTCRRPERLPSVCHVATGSSRALPRTSGRLLTRGPSSPLLLTLPITILPPRPTLSCSYLLIRSPRASTRVCCVTAPPTAHTRWERESQLLEARKQMIMVPQITTLFSRSRSRRPQMKSRCVSPTEYIARFPSSFPRKTCRLHVHGLVYRNHFVSWPWSTIPIRTRTT